MLKNFKMQLENLVFSWGSQRANENAGGAGASVG